MANRGKGGVAVLCQCVAYKHVRKQESSLMLLMTGESNDVQASMQDKAKWAGRCHDKKQLQSSNLTTRHTSLAHQLHMQKDCG